MLLCNRKLQIIAGIIEAKYLLSLAAMIFILLLLTVTDRMSCTTTPKINTASTSISDYKSTTSCKKCDSSTTSTTQRHISTESSFTKTIPATSITSFSANISPTASFTTSIATSISTTSFKTSNISSTTASSPQSSSSMIALPVTVSIVILALLAIIVLATIISIIVYIKSKRGRSTNEGHNKYSFTTAAGKGASVKGLLLCVCSNSLMHYYSYFIVVLLPYILHLLYNRTIRKV